MTRIPLRSLLLAALLAIAGAAHAKPPKLGAPPKDGKAEDEKSKWFEKLPQVHVDDLHPGDIVLRKEYDLANHKVALSQKALPSGHGSRFTVHAALYIGKGDVIEASGAHGVIQAKLGPDYNWIVYRPTHASDANLAVGAAEWMLKQHIKYSKGHCVSTFAHFANFGDNAKKRAKMVQEKKAPYEEMMCSEFVVYTYQSNDVGPLPLPLDAKHTSPMKLESWLNDEKHNFEFVGAIHAGQKHQGGQTDDDVEFMLALQNATCKKPVEKDDDVIEDAAYKKKLEEQEKADYIADLDL